MYAKVVIPGWYCEGDMHEWLYEEVFARKLQAVIWKRIAQRILQNKRLQILELQVVAFPDDQRFLYMWVDPHCRASQVCTAVISDRPVQFVC